MALVAFLLLWVHCDQVDSLQYALMRSVSCASPPLITKRSLFVTEGWIQSDEDIKYPTGDCGVLLRKHRISNFSDYPPIRGQTPS